MSRIRIAVLVSGGGTNLEALIGAERKGLIKSGEISLVLSNKAGAYALTRAERAGIKTATVLRSECASAEEFEDRMMALLDGEDIGLIVLAGFLAILSERFTSHYRDRIINVHPSLIPSFCGKGFYGLKVHEAALAYGVKVSGATVHFVNEVPDGGRIILQRAVEVKDGDTPESLQRRIMEEAEWKLLPEATELVCRRMLENKKG
ncbi:MAG: phosphoribosylglycinamide formyltransferase [Clostridia bacterium]|nr:phosphoribosylglycinamide formyltransferase [Clostridia bacterium]